MVERKGQRTPEPRVDPADNTTAALLWYQMEEPLAERIEEIPIGKPVEVLRVARSQHSSFLFSPQLEPQTHMRQNTIPFLHSNRFIRFEPHTLRMRQNTPTFLRGEKIGKKERSWYVRDWYTSYDGWWCWRERDGGGLGVEEERWVKVWWETF